MKISKRINLPEGLIRSLDLALKPEGFVHRVNLLEVILQEYLKAVDEGLPFPLLPVDNEDGDKELKDFRLEPEIITAIQERSEYLYSSKKKFSTLVQEIVKGWLDSKGY